MVTEVVVDGLGASVVVGAALVVGVTVVVTVVGGGAGATVWVAVLGSGAADEDSVAGAGAGAVDDVGATLLEVTAGLSEVPAVVNFTTAYTSSASTAAVSTPRPTNTAGRWCQGAGGGGVAG